MLELEAAIDRSKTYAAETGGVRPFRADQQRDPAGQAARLAHPCAACKCTTGSAAIFRLRSKLRRDDPLLVKQLFEERAERTARA